MFVVNSESDAEQYGQTADCNSSRSHSWSAAALVEVTVAQKNRCNDGPRVDDNACPAGCNLDPHCWLIHRQVQA